MPVDAQDKVPTLVEVGTRTLNVAYLIVSDQVGSPDPTSAVMVTMVSGDRMRFEGDEARRWLSQLARFVPRPGEEPEAQFSTPTKVLRAGGGAG